MKREQLQYCLFFIFLTGQMTLFGQSAPIFENSTPNTSSIAGTTFTLNTDIDKAGTIFYVVLTNGATAPTSAEVIAGTGNGGAGAVTSGNATVNSGGFTNAFNVTGLTSATDYDAYVVARDTESTPNVQSSPTLVNVRTNAIPSLSHPAGNSQFVENFTSLAFPGGSMTLTDADVSNNTDFGVATSATVQITGNYISGEDVLTFNAQGLSQTFYGDIAGSFNAVTGTVTLTSAGAASPQNWSEAIRSTAYSNTSDAPNTTSRVIQYQFNDGSDNSILLSRTLDVFAHNDSPSISGLDATSPNTFTEDSPATVIDGNMVIADAEMSALNSGNGNYNTFRISVRRSGGANSEDQFSLASSATYTISNGFLMRNGIVLGAFNVSQGALIIAFTSASQIPTTAMVSEVAQLISYSNSSNTPPTSVTLAITADDRFVATGSPYDQGPTTTQNVIVNITANNDPSVLSITDQSPEYISGTPLNSINNSINVTDVETGLSVNYGQATTGTVQITGNFVSGGQDVLTFNSQGASSSLYGDITAGAFNNTTGVLTLSSAGAATPIQWTQAFHLIGYNNTSSTPSTLSRTVTFTFNDGGTNSNTVSEVMTIFSGPRINNLDATSANTFIEGSSPIILDGNVTVLSTGLDPLNSGNGNYNGATLTIARNGGASTNDSFSLGTSATYTVSGTDLRKNGTSIGSFTNSSGTLTISFSDASSIPVKADVIAIMQLISYSNSNTNPPLNITLDVQINDGVATDTKNIIVNITGTVNQQTVTVSPQSGLCGIQPVVSLASSETNTNYYLRDNSDNSVVQGPVSGTGSGVSFASETLHASKTYNVLARKAVTSGALNFNNNSAEYLDAGSYTHATNSFTLEMWAKVRSSNQWDHVIENGGVEYGFSANYRFEVGNQGQLFFDMSNGSVSTSITISAGWTYGTWYHWAITYDGTTLRVYQDGVQVGSKTASVNISGRSGTLLMGSFRRTERHFDGELDEVRIWNIARTASEISNNRNTLLTGNETGLLLYYDFEEGSGTTANNKTNSSNKATLVNMEAADWVTGQTFEDSNNPIQMNTTPTVTINPVANQTITINQPTGQSAVISIASSEVGANYSLRNNADNTVLAGPIAGTGGQIIFPLQSLGANRTYNVYATAGNCNYQLTTTPTATFVAPNAGNSGGMWSSNSTWSSGSVPTMSSPVQVGNGSTITVDISNATASSLDIVSGGILNIDNTRALTVENGFQNSGTVTITSNTTNSGVLHVKGTASGTVSYTRGGLVPGNWSIVTPPVAGQTVSSFIAANDIRQNTANTKYALAYYDDSQAAGSKWVYYLTSGQDLTTIVMEVGRSYAVSTNTATSIVFSGTLTTTTVNKTISTSQWNAIGNPYTAFIAANQNANSNFINDNTAAFEPANQGIYIWDNAQSKYVAVASSDGLRSLPPGQGFFVRASSTGTQMVFNQSRRMSQPATGDGTFDRNGSADTTPTINLFLKSGRQEVNTRIKYFDHATEGVDRGYDMQNFGGASFDVYTKLLDRNETRNFTLQSLPTDKWDAQVISIGLKATVGSHIKFSADVTHLPNGVYAYLEDALTGRFTLLNQKDTNSYEVILEETIDGTGRFYLHTLTSRQPFETLPKVHIFMHTKDLLRITGISQEMSEVRVYNTLGVQVFHKSFEGNGSNDILLPPLRTGVYIANVRTKTGSSNQKIIIE